MHDAIVVENTGIAATAIITDRFAPTAQAMAQVLGMPDLPFAVIPHPISHNDGGELRVKAASAVQQCVVILTQPSRVPQTIGPHERAG
jgi:hypothetical protein